MSITFAAIEKGLADGSLRIDTSGERSSAPRRRKSKRALETTTRIMEAISKEPKDTSVKALKIQKMTVPFADKKRDVQFLSSDLQTLSRDIFEKGILRAKKSVTLIMYAITNAKVIDALKTTAARGVCVTVIYDSEQTSAKDSFFGKKVHGYSRGSREAPMHQKLLVVDGRRVWLGSTNMSISAVTQQRNMVIHMSCETVARRIEALSRALIEKTEFSMSPLCLRFPDTDMTMFFNPVHGDQASQLIVEKISKATARVFVAMYTFTYKKFANELISAKKRGVDVRVVLDRENMKKMNQPVFSLLRGEGVSCGFRAKKGLLHHKIVFIDSLVIAGSCNFTGAAFSTNDETMLVLDPVPQKFQSELQTWWDSVEEQSS